MVRFFVFLFSLFALTGALAQPQRLALEIGFVNRVVAGEQLMATAYGMAERIAANAPLTVRAARELVYLSTEMGRSAAQRAAVHLFDRVYRSADAKEGPLAFREKRKPRWTGQ
ncbi:MAG: enoyl-CoA hydratase-related protein [Betaproteobacteria bacterium]